jgi:hypothetical protein
VSADPWEWTRTTAEAALDGHPDASGALIVRDKLWRITEDGGYVTR